MKKNYHYNDILDVCKITMLCFEITCDKKYSLLTIKKFLVLRDQLSTDYSSVT